MARNRPARREASWGHSSCSSRAVTNDCTASGKSLPVATPTPASASVAAVVAPVNGIAVGAPLMVAAGRTEACSGSRSDWPAAGVSVTSPPTSVSQWRGASL